MAQTKLDIINLSLMLLGKQPVSSLDNNTQPIVNSANNLFDKKCKTIIQGNNWRFATKTQQLPLVNQQPEPNLYWKQIYQLPADFLQIRRLYDYYGMYEVFGKQVWIPSILSLQQQLWCEYAYMPDVSIFPDSFCEYLAYEIAVILALSNAQSPVLADFLRREANSKYAEASAADNRNRPNVQIQRNPFLSARVTNGSSGYGWGGYQN